VQALPSLQRVPAEALLYEHLPSTQDPEMQRLLLWQSELLVQKVQPPMGWLMMVPVAGSQLSLVHGFPSLVSLGVPLQAPWEQLSPSVQGFPSLHGTLGPGTVMISPVAGLHSLCVQGLPSSTFFGSPEQAPLLLHRSLEVQAFPSLQGAPEGRKL
jgi:hypothetical protein